MVPSNIVAIILLIVWSSTLILCVTNLLFFLKRKNSSRLLLVLYILCLVPCLCRICNAAIFLGRSVDTAWQNQSLPEIVVGSSAGYTIFVVLSLLCFSFGVLYHSSNARNINEDQKRIDIKKRLFVLFFVANVLVLSGWAIFLILLATSSHETFVRIHMIEAGYASLLCAIAAAVFFIYGALLWYSFGNHVSSRARGLSKVRKVCDLLISLSHFCLEHFIAQSSVFC